MIHVKEILTELAKNKFVVKLSKCKFLADEIEFLGHVVSAEGIRADHRKVIAIKNLVHPRSAEEVRQFLGMAGYYQKFIEKFPK